MKKNYMKKLTALVLGGLLTTTMASAAMAESVDMTLEESVRTALDNNYSIKQQEAEYDSAVWARHQARRSFGPTVNWQSTATKMGGKYYEDMLKLSRNYGNTLSLTMPIYTGGQLEGAIKAADLAMNANELGLELSKQQVKAATMSAYYQALQAKNQIKVAQDSVNTLTEHLKNVNAQYTVGTVAKSDVLGTQVQMANAEQNLINANNSYDVAIASLNNVMGLPTDTELNLTDSLDYNVYEIPLEECTAYARSNRSFQYLMDMAQELDYTHLSQALNSLKPVVGDDVAYRILLRFVTSKLLFLLKDHPELMFKKNRDLISRHKPKGKEWEEYDAA